MKKQPIKDMQITNLNSFLIVWFNALKLNDTGVWNMFAYLILFNFFVVILAIYAICN